MVPDSELTVSDRGRLIQAARLFYLDDRSKVEIAQELGVSRFKVARMLEQARAEGLVTITLHDQGAELRDLSRTLAEKLGLSEAMVIAADGDSLVRRQQVAAAAAEMLAATLRDGEVLGITWGRTLTDMTERLTELPRIAVVQLTGTVGSRLDRSPVEVVRRLSKATAGSAHPIFAPMVVDDAATAAAIRRQADVASAIAMFSRVTTAVLALGSWDPLDSQLAESLASEELDELRRRGVVAEVSSILMAADGTLLASDFTDRTIAICADEVRRIPRVIVVAAGSHKVQAMRALMRARLVTGVITDQECAEALLADQDLIERGAGR